MLKLENGEVITLNNLEHVIACQGCGSRNPMSEGYGSETSYSISDEQIKSILESPIVMMRVYTNDGYMEMDVKEKRYKKLVKAFALIMD